jgi:hypothetical protein
VEFGRYVNTFSEEPAETLFRVGGQIAQIKILNNMGNEGESLELNIQLISRKHLYFPMKPAITIHLQVYIFYTEDSRLFRNAPIHV